ncbi:predicted protein [Verticillium alfalfae VaMs.102]|uniref:Predicted protein n=1 Tax=Verticillium alfalfae (strain VaMs.102 / ATCC MYA-4576 / FGSC 10136) TaxID=526221 RepID=C9SFN8_VERA1|nr:predicted protein [Verticillium alfalfae VaMs.102]EEY17983.1 predicted protein [Verticillium alfalfae VaMs.102]
MTCKARNNEPRVRHEVIPFRHPDTLAYPPQPFDTAWPDTDATTSSTFNCPTAPHQCATPGPPKLDQQRLQASPRFAEPFTSHGGCIPCWLESQSMYSPNCIHRRN